MCHLIAYKKQIACNSLSYPLFDSVLVCLYLHASFDFLEVSILDVILWLLCAACLLTAVET